jgi:hypothetical protein
MRITAKALQLGVPPPALTIVLVIKGNPRRWSPAREGLRGAVKFASRTTPSARAIPQGRFVFQEGD